MANPSLLDDDYMAAALELAKRGAGWVNPNPMVGCLIVKDGEILGAGYHTRFGAPHAEREALADCVRRGRDTVGATAYVTLEPCSHTGKTPPCCDALIDAGIARVVVGSNDPNPLVAGAGIARLVDAGIDVKTGVLSQRCDALNAAFFHFITTRTPYVVAKFASTLDGKIATREGLSKWITGPIARARVHEDRSRYAAIMVGVGTVIADDPQLSARIARDDAMSNHQSEDSRSGDERSLCDPRLDSVLGSVSDPLPDKLASSLRTYINDPRPEPHQPTRIIVDTHLRTPLESNVVKSANRQPTIIATCVSDDAHHRAYEELGCSVVPIDEDEQGRVDLLKLLKTLGLMGIDSVYVEGGAKLLGALFDLDIPNRVDAYIAPKIFGGVGAPSPVGGNGVDAPDMAIYFEQTAVCRLGDDILVSGEISPRAKHRR